MAQESSAFTAQCIQRADRDMFVGRNVEYIIISSVILCRNGHKLPILCSSFDATQNHQPLIRNSFVIDERRGVNCPLGEPVGLTNHSSVCVERMLRARAYRATQDILNSSKVDLLAGMRRTEVWRGQAGRRRSLHRRKVPCTKALVIRA